MSQERLWTVALIAALFSSTGCTSSNQYRRALDEKDAEIRTLREERAELKSERDAHLGELDELGVRLQEANARLADSPTPQEGLQSQPGLDELGIGYGMRNGMAVITIPSSITFSSGKAQLTTQGGNALREVATVLKEAHPTGVYSIEGHTDTDPIQKSGYSSNRDLSLERAMAVLSFLVEECRIPDEQCVVVGHGQYRPVDAGSSTDSKAKNRRVEIVVHAATP